ncbi:MAG TPA: pyrroloquinoline quinone biosynthesis protein PqqE [Chthoniobacterales bacterium]|nr:pyrroloquinoline quinone biosynthesis protein PqqE [Chthoniobacterales bacterium]
MDIAERPYTLLAELTYRCPLHCPYCSNPVRAADKGELGSEQWKRVIQEAAALGVLQIGFSGGEPLQRKDLEALVRVARESGLYTNLITSGLRLNETRARQLAESGLDNIQLSFQAAGGELADRIAGVRNAHHQKLRAARLIRESGVALSLNVVLHRFNIDGLRQIIDFAEELRATRLELANTQYYGWAFQNRSLLIPTRGQTEVAAQIALAARRRLKGVMEILYVLPDYFAGRPKPCMNGWGRRYLTVNPSGAVLPCPTAGEIPGLVFDNVRERPLAWIWNASESFNRFRGTEWMPEPCRSCPQREIDFGGCRCQAALLTGDPGKADPACELSPHHQLVCEVVDRGSDKFDVSDLLYRQNP